MKKFLVILFVLTIAVSAMGTAQWDGTGNWTNTTGLWKATLAPDLNDPPDNGDSFNVRSGQLTFSSGSFSGSGLHMGHALNYTIGDIFARFKKLKGLMHILSIYNNIKRVIRQNLASASRNSKSIH